MSTSHSTCWRANSCSVEATRHQARKEFRYSGSNSTIREPLTVKSRGAAVPGHPLPQSTKCVRLHSLGLEVSPFYLLSNLALRGAEIIFCPIWGDGRWGGSVWPIVARARAIDNQVFFVGSMYGGGRSLIIDPRGHILQDSRGDDGLFIAEVDLNAPIRTLGSPGHGWGHFKNQLRRIRRPDVYGEIYGTPTY